jgi:ribosomal protein S18 acetylase RimI-like enzyme
MMNNNPVEIVEFDNQKHREQVITLWQEVFGYKAERNSPKVAIDKKISVDDGLFFVAISHDLVVGTVLAGYDGHRGWIYSMAVNHKHQKKGIGSALLAHAERRLASLGCVKINLQILDGNEAVQRFYQANGYLTEKRISMGKQLVENIENS